jgi:hypothetical protein
MSLWLSRIFTFTNLIPAILGITVFRKTDPKYRPFFYFIWFGTLNDLFGMLLVRGFSVSSTPLNSFYILFEFALVVWLFSKWQTGSKKLLLFLLLFGAGVWAYDNLILHTVFRVNSIFRVVYAFIIVYLSIEHINSLVFTGGRKLRTHPSFVICIGFLIYYTYRALLETFYIIDVRFSNSFYTNLFLILSVINGLTNFIYAYVMLCFRTNKKYIYSY